MFWFGILGIGKNSAGEPVEVVTPQPIDREGLSTLYQEQAEAVYSYLRLRTGNQVEAEDLTSTVFFKVIESWHNYRPDRASRAAWIFGITRHVLADYWRSRSRRQTATLDDITWLADQDYGPEELALKQDEARALLELVQDLPPLQQEAIGLRYTAQLDYSEIAQVLGRKEPAVRMLVHRGLEAIRKRLAQQAELATQPEVA